jgi:hypothetical protein
VQWIKLPKQQNKNANTPFLTDIVSHLPTSFGNQYFSSDRVTWGHETTHGINSHIRNTIGGPINGPNGRIAGFYVGDDKACVMSQPKLKLSQIAGVIPQNLRGNRYQLYFVSQRRDWEDMPLYPFDEWVAYTNGAAVGIEIGSRTADEQVTLNNSDVMVGALEFSVYAMCVCIAIDKYDPDYLRTNEQFKEFVAHELKRSIAIYKKGIVMPEYRWDTPLEKNVRANAECVAILRKMYGDRLTMETLFGTLTTLNDTQPRTLGDLWSENRIYSFLRVRNVETLEDFLMTRPLNFQQGRPVLMALEYCDNTGKGTIANAWEPKWCLLSTKEELCWLAGLSELQATFQVKKSYRRVLIREACEPQHDSRHSEPEIPVMGFSVSGCYG